MSPATDRVNVTADSVGISSGRHQRPDESGGSLDGVVLEPIAADNRVLHAAVPRPPAGAAMRDTVSAMG